MFFNPPRYALRKKSRDSLTITIGVADDNFDGGSDYETGEDEEEFEGRQKTADHPEQQQQQQAEESAKPALGSSSSTSASASKLSVSIKSPEDSIILTGSQSQKKGKHIFAVPSWFHEFFNILIFFFSSRSSYKKIEEESNCNSKRFHLPEIDSLSRQKVVQTIMWRPCRWEP